jgi:glyoxylase-like metal-dependent hydrolase (beta-lactamase superfamily II)
MTIEKVKSRNIVFRYHPAEWDLNIHLIMGDKYNYIVDTGLGSKSVAPVKEYIKDSRKQMIVINTHYHWDHVWGNHAFCDCPIVSHTLCREITAAKWDEMMSRNGSFVRGEARMCLPNLVFQDMLYFPDDGIRIFHTPGHTQDCISVLDEVEGIINVGDNIGDTVDEIVPEIDTEKDVYIDTLRKYRQFGFDTCISGHNVTLGRDALDTVLKAIGAE